MIVYHYSRGIHLPAILDCGYLDVATEGFPSSVRSAVWFSLSPEWPRFCGTAYRRNGRWYDATMQEAHEAIGLTRFVVDESIARYTWQHYKQHSGISRRHAHGLYQRAIELGNSPVQWRVSYEPVNEKDWQFVQVWNGHEWEELNEQNLAAMAERRSNFEVLAA